MTTPYTLENLKMKAGKFTPCQTCSETPENLYVIPCHKCWIRRGVYSELDGERGSDILLAEHQRILTWEDNNDSSILWKVAPNLNDMIKCFSCIQLEGMGGAAWCARCRAFNLQQLQCSNEQQHLVGIEVDHASVEQTEELMPDAAEPHQDLQGQSEEHHIHLDS